MLGGEHHRERVSERIQGLQNQPRCRGYLPGCHTRAAGSDGRTSYSIKTLQGNWAEERRDAAYYSGKPVVPTELQAQWTSTYRCMVEESTEPEKLPERVAALRQSSFVAVVDGRSRCFPGHQPLTDPNYTTVKSSTALDTYQRPRDVVRAEKEYVPPVLGNSPDAQPKGVLLRVRHKLLHRAGGTTFTEVRRVLQSMDNTGNQKLNHKELQRGLEKVQAPLTAAEAAVLVKYFDHEGSGEVDIITFVRGLRGDMSERRLDLVKKAFELLDENLKSVVRLSDILALYDVQQHPDYRSEKATKELLKHKFASQWDSKKDDVIDFDEFKEYYSDVSAEIGNDQYFELVLRNVWHISGGEGTCKNYSCRRVHVIHTNGRRTEEEIVNDLGIGPLEMDKMKANLASQGINDVAEILL